MPEASALQQALDLGLNRLATGDLGAAHRILSHIVTLHPRHAAARQALGLVAKRQGKLEDAVAHFEIALALAPEDANSHNNLANALDDLGRSAAALRHYNAAVDLAPAGVDAHINRALLLRNLGHLVEAEVGLCRATEMAPDMARAWLALGLVRMDLDHIAGAIAAFDRTLVLDPADSMALLARAQLATDTGSDALGYYGRLGAMPGTDHPRALGEATALHRTGQGSKAIGILESLVARDPEWREGQAALAKLRWQWQGPEGFLRGYGAPPLPALRSDYLAALARAGRYHAILAEMDAGGWADEFLLVQAVASSEVGDLQRADAAFARLHKSGETAGVALVRHLLRKRTFDAAAKEAARLAYAGDRAAWPYLATSWRLLDDERWQRLDDPAFVQVVDLAALLDLAGLEKSLLSLHVSPRAPFDQSVRAGTQTDGNLFVRTDSAIQRLQQVLARAVASYVEQLPPHDGSHPLLGERRSGLRFSGAWSVRLADGGFHTNHTHPRGWISSAFYVVAPPSTSGGHLLLGQPPSELELGLGPTQTVAALPGRLVLFPSYLWHGTANFDKGSRLSVAFDVVPEGFS